MQEHQHNGLSRHDFGCVEIITPAYGISRESQLTNVQAEDSVNEYWKQMSSAHGDSIRFDSWDKADRPLRSSEVSWTAILADVHG